MIFHWMSIEQNFFDTTVLSHGQRDYKNCPFSSKFKEKVFCYYSYKFHNQSPETSLTDIIVVTGTFRLLVTYTQTRRHRHTVKHKTLFVPTKVNVQLLEMELFE